MIRRTSFQIAAVGTALTFASACTMKSQEAPPLSGPSEYATSIAISASPDVLTQDGASQSLVSITARDANSSPIRNLSLRAEIQVGGVHADFGSLSARNLVTGSDGRATVVYTAPVAPSVAVDSGTMVNIVITPVGTDFNNSTPRTASIRLVPPGSVAPPDGLQPHFTFTPPTPTDGQTVLFVACQDPAKPACAKPSNPIANYSWTFGDGRFASDASASHAYSTAGTYVVTLSVSDGYGRSASTQQSITVSSGANPSAAFSSSPSAPAINQQVNFNASATRAAPGRTITSYEWDFGDSTPGKSGVTASHSYSLAGTYTAVLTVTDDLGKKGTATGTVTVK